MLKTVLLKRKLIEFSISSRLYQTGNAGVFGYKPGTHKEWRENFARDGNFKPITLLQKIKGLTFLSRIGP